MNPNFMLPDSITYILIASGTAAVITLIIIAIDNMKDSLRENKVREFKIAVEKNRKSQTLADYYTAVADCDPYDRDYWDETAKKFAEGVK